MPECSPFQWDSAWNKVYLCQRNKLYYSAKQLLEIICNRYCIRDEVKKFRHQNTYFGQFLADFHDLNIYMCSWKCYSVMWGYQDRRGHATCNQHLIIPDLPNSYVFILEHPVYNFRMKWQDARPSRMILHDISLKCAKGISCTIPSPILVENGLYSPRYKTCVGIH